jgi:hypothetical protein
MAEADYSRKLAKIDRLPNGATSGVSYEHQAVEFYDMNLSEIGEKLDKLSKEGWELVCVEVTPMPFCRIAWLRRPRS